MRVDAFAPTIHEIESNPIKNRLDTDDRQVESFFGVRGELITQSSI
jgi:hypothetical protein